MKKNRWQEPSTWNGISGLLLAASTLPTPAAPWLAGLGGMAAAVGVWLREGGKDDSAFAEEEA